jgi:hypothetical protein
VQEYIDTARLLMHLSQNYRGQIGPYFDRMTTQPGIDWVLLKLFETVEDETQ